GGGRRSTPTYRSPGCGGRSPTCCPTSPAANSSGPRHSASVCSSGSARRSAGLRRAGSSIAGFPSASTPTAVTSSPRIPSSRSGSWSPARTSSERPSTRGSRSPVRRRWRRRRAATGGSSTTSRWGRSNRVSTAIWSSSTGTTSVFLRTRSALSAQSSLSSAAGSPTTRGCWRQPASPAISRHEAATTGEGLMFGHVLLITAVLSTPFAVRMEAASALDGTGQVPLVTVEKARCRPGDKVETGLQGQVPVGDRVSGRAAEGYFCNMTMVGGVRTRSFANFDVYGDCAYYTESPGGFGGPGADGHGNVVDVSDPTRPVVTATLTARAMGNAGESLRVNAKRGLLVA